jgi:hypothetical protein
MIFEVHLKMKVADSYLSTKLRDVTPQKAVTVLN